MRTAWLVLLVLAWSLTGCPTGDDGDDDAGDDDVGDDDTADDDTADDDTGDDDTAPQDADGDGFAPPEDCNDADDQIHPGADEICDELDHDCDGVADPGGCVTDSFVQEADNRFDFLWVVEDSFTDFETIHGLLTDAAPALFDGLQKAGVDFRMAAVTTSSPMFVGAAPVLEPTTPDLLGGFAAITHVGDQGSATERGLKFGWDALTMAVNQTPPNLGFLREDAGLHVIYVSEEPDQSGSWSTYLTNYQSLKDDPDRFVAHAIVGVEKDVPASCTGPAGPAWPGDGYADVANATGGILASVCDEDWSAPFAAVATPAPFLLKWFELSQVPVESTIAVQVNGVLWVGLWAYDGDVNGVWFDLMTLPQAGDLIEISYQVAP